MQWSAGSRVGPYEILDTLGAGGMGEVFRARDARLQRTVAIKVLSSRHPLDPERRRRFLVEARAASALNHPHIITIYDVGEEDGRDYLVMELVPGQPLDRLIPARGLALADALSYGAQVANALAAAHAAGIVHRDIKPGNVVVGPDGQVKVLDFGLAKLSGPPPGEVSETLTQEPPLTETGTVVGTAAYMSPEQAAGRPADSRTDTFSLGVVLYEMIAGARPFRGDSQVELLHSIIRDQPQPISDRKPDVPPELEDIFAKALAKDPADRYQHAGDFALDLRRLRDALASRRLRSQSAPRPVPRRRSALLLLAAALVVAMALGAAYWRLNQIDYFWTNPLADARITRITDFEGDEVDSAISTDGKFIGFLSDRDGMLDAWVTQAGTGNFLNLTRGRFPNLIDEIAFSIGFTPDGSNLWVRAPTGGVVGGGIRTIPVMGGTPRPIFNNGPVNITWSPDGSRAAYFVGGKVDTINLTGADGSNPQALFSTVSDEHAHYPIWSPDGKYIYFVRGGVRLAQADIWRVPVTGGNAQQITHHHSAIRYPAMLDERTLLYIAPSPDGAGTSLFAVDVERRVPHRLNIGVEQYRSVAASTQGRNRRIVASVANPSSHVWSVPISAGIAPEKDATQVSLPSVRASGPRAAPDFLIYLSSTAGDAGIWKMKDGVGVELWKPTDGSFLALPAVSGDGQQVCFVARKNGRGTLHVMTADGANRRLLAPALDVQDEPSWSPDAQSIVVAAATEDPRRTRLYKVSPADGKFTVLLDASAHYPQCSPDGQFILFRSTDKAKIDAVTPEGAPYPINLPDLVFRNSVENPYRLLPDSRQLVILQGQYRKENLWLTDIRTGEMRRLTDLTPGFSINSFDVSRDGKTILFDRIRQNADIVLIEPRR